MINVITNGGIAILSFNNPPEGYLDFAQVERITAALTQIKADPAIQVVILTGSLPGVFIRHYDVKEIAGTAERLKRSSKSDADIVRIGSANNAISTCFAMLEHFDRPTIAAINGYCQGGGLELALCCDFRIAAAGDYRIGFPEVHLGIVPGSGGTYRLTRLVGQARALDLILRGRALSPEEALQAGLVNEVAHDALERSLELARELNAIPAAAVASAKQLIKSVDHHGSQPALAQERSAFSLLLRNSHDAAALCGAFVAFEGDINAFIASRRLERGAL
jgi:enoyl-CoA hydratase